MSGIRDIMFRDANFNLHLTGGQAGIIVAFKAGNSDDQVALILSINQSTSQLVCDVWPGF